MFKKVLIANRGEIAARIARTTNRLGVASVAVYSEADAGAPHTALTDQAFLIGPPPVSESYLNIDRLVEVARETGCDAVHPGYGLLSENTGFIERVHSEGLAFIGPTPESVALMGDKAEARSFAKRAGVPVVPGSEDEVTSEDEAAVFAETFGYPVIVKAAAGGGGIGMKVAAKEQRLRKAVAECMRRGESAFGSARIYLERYIESPRHVEIQVLADAHGNAVHLFERECSIQRRHQKVIEETPSVLMSRHPRLRATMSDAALTLVKASGYTNAGTVEFIVDETGEFYFIEMNTRLQVEHALTEMTTGLDLVELQLRVAAGERLSLNQQDIALDGHAIECRVYAEDPGKMFMPAPGQIDKYVEPDLEGIRVDSGVKANWRVTPDYDPMVAKVIAHADSRDASRVRMIEGLGQMSLDGLTNNIDMHIAVLCTSAFQNGDFHTGWLEEWIKQWVDHTRDIRS